MKFSVFITETILPAIARQTADRYTL